MKNLNFCAGAFCGIAGMVIGGVIFIAGAAVGLMLSDKKEAKHEQKTD